MIFWSAEIIDRLRDYWERGLPASQIAKMINEEFAMRFTRNSIIGKVHRLGLKKRKESTRKASAYKQVQPAPTLRRRAELFVLRPASENAAPGALHGGVTFAELLPHHCRWPFGNPKLPTFRYCGLPAIEPYPYCAEHVRIAYRIISGALSRESAA